MIGVNHNRFRGLNFFVDGLFDLPNSDKRPRFILMGLNPGEGPNDGIYVDRKPINEETRDYDFRTQSGYTSRYGKVLPRSETKWVKRATLLGGSKDFIQTEFFFWSSKDLGADFTDRFLTTLRNSPHVDFCVEKNKELIEREKPSFVLVTSLREMMRLLQFFMKCSIVTYALDQVHGKSPLFKI